MSDIGIGNYLGKRTIKLRSGAVNLELINHKYCMISCNGETLGIKPECLPDLIDVIMSFAAEIESGESEED